jgi:AraC family L-rhamnose operon transcriptional activator RhaR
MRPPDVLITARRRFIELNQLELRLQIGSFRCEILGWGLLGERWWRNHLHTHSFFEVCCTFDGRGTFLLNGRTHTVQRGDIFVARPGELHEIVSSEPHPLAIHFWSFILKEEPEALRDRHDAAVDALLRDFAHGRRWLNSESGALQSTLLLLTQEIAERAPGFRNSIDGLATKLILDTARAVAPHTPASVPLAIRSDDIERNVAARMARYLQDNHMRPITVRDAAAQVNLSERHAARIFRRSSGVTIKSYVLNLRVEAASRRLITTRDAIKQIAEECGFGDVQHFTTTFRTRTGLTPAAFRSQRGTRFADPTKPGHVEPNVRFTQ